MSLVGLFLIATGVFIHISKKSYGVGILEELSLKDTIVIGLTQGFSILPGISRSGVTVAALLLSDVRQSEAFRLSFLMSVPVVFAATIMGVVTANIQLETLPVFAGIISSFVIGYLEIDLIIAISKPIRFDVFCILFGLIAFLWTLI